MYTLKANIPTGHDYAQFYSPVFVDHNYFAFNIDVDLVRHGWHTMNFHMRQRACAATQYYYEKIGL